MTVTKIIAVLVVVAVAAVGGMWYTGMWSPKDPLKVDPSKLKKTDKKEEDPYKEAYRQFNLKKWDEAKDAYQEGLSKDPNNAQVPWARYRIAFCYEQMGNKPEAIKAYQEYLKKHPRHEKEALAKKRLGFLGASPK